MNLRAAIAVLALVVVLGGLVAAFLFSRRPVLDEVMKEPMRSQIVVREAGMTKEGGLMVPIIEQVAEGHAFGAGNCAIMDIGDLRLVLPGVQHPASATLGLISLTTTAPRAALRGIQSHSGAGSGKLRYEFRTTRGRTEARWGPATFAIDNGHLEIDGREIPFGEGPRMIVLGEDGTVGEVLPLGAPTRR